MNPTQATMGKIGIISSPKINIPKHIQRSIYLQLSVSGFISLTANADRGINPGSDKNCIKQKNPSIIHLYGASPSNMNHICVI